MRGVIYINKLVEIFYGFLTILSILITGRFYYLWIVSDKDSDFTFMGLVLSNLSLLLAFL